MVTGQVGGKIAPILFDLPDHLLLPVGMEYLLILLLVLRTVLRTVLGLYCRIPAVDGRQYYLYYYGMLRLYTANYKRKQGKVFIEVKD
jgi:hypothetical protein